VPTSPTSALALLAEPRREQIMREVWRTERSAGQIAGVMPVTFGAVSQHLRILLDAGLVTVRLDGRRRWYSANRAALGPLAPALEQMWFGKLSQLKHLAEAEQRRIDAEGAAARPAPRKASHDKHRSSKKGRK
jgi:DNA-binding transcriptional ArsR family regulator